MEDLGAKGSLFTWSNNQSGEERVYERLGRVLINLVWVVQKPNTQCTDELAIG